MWFKSTEILIQVFFFLLGIFDLCFSLSVTFHGARERCPVSADPRRPPRSLLWPVSGPTEAASPPSRSPCRPQARTSVGKSVYRSHGPHASLWRMSDPKGLWGLFQGRLGTAQVCKDLPLLGCRPTHPGLPTWANDNSVRFPLEIP